MQTVKMSTDMYHNTESSMSPKFTLLMYSSYIWNFLLSLFESVFLTADCDMQCCVPSGLDFEGASGFVQLFASRASSHSLISKCQSVAS